MIIMGGPGTRKSTVGKAVVNIINRTVQDSTSLPCLGITGTADFVMSWAPLPLFGGLPNNRPYNNLNGSKLQNLQQSLDGIKLIIIDEISMMGKNILYQIDNQLRQASKKCLESFGGFTVVLIGDFQQLPPVGESSTYQPDNSPDTLAYNVFQNVVIL